jgi:hypothetical protein
MKIEGISMYDFKVTSINRSSVLFANGKAKVQSLSIHFTSNEVKKSYISVSDVEARRLIKLITKNLTYNRKKTTKLKP